MGPVWVLYEDTKGQEGLRDVLHRKETAGVGMGRGPVTPEVIPWDAQISHPAQCCTKRDYTLQPLHALLPV